MFCDLVGSTGISAQLDAEEWRDLWWARISTTASAAVTEIGGYVAKELGDGLMAQPAKNSLGLTALPSIPDPARAGAT
jgi:class 3 adenylate cyclase